MNVEKKTPSVRREKGALKTKKVKSEGAEEMRLSGKAEPVVSRSPKATIDKTASAKSSDPAINPTSENALSNVDTLVFEGGSVKGLVYVGALQVLESYSHSRCARSFLDSIKRVGGTSAGSIVALLIALGLTVHQIAYVMNTTAFSTFADMGVVASSGTLGKGWRLYQQGYLCEGAVFTAWVEGLLKTYLGDAQITFGELSALAKRRPELKALHVYAVRLNDGAIVEFSSETTPTVSIGLAVRMSMSIPVFFKPVRVRELRDAEDRVIGIERDEESGTAYYVDGGVKANYPYQLLKHAYKLGDDQLLGFKVDTQEERLRQLLSDRSSAGSDTRVGLSSWHQKITAIEENPGLNLLPRILSALMSGQEDQHNQDRAESGRTIHCHDLGVSTFAFDLKEPKKKELVSSGASAAMTYLAHMEQRAVPLAPANDEPVTQAGLDFETGYQSLETARVASVVNAVQRGIEIGEVDQQAPPTQAYLGQLKEELGYLQKEVTRLESNRRKIVLVARGAVVGDDFVGKMDASTRGPELTLPENASEEDRAFLREFAAEERAQLQRIRKELADTDMTGVESGARVGARGQITVEVGHQAGTLTIEQRLSEDSRRLGHSLSAVNALMMSPDSVETGADARILERPRAPKGGLFDSASMSCENKMSDSDVSEPARSKGTGKKKTTTERLRTPEASVKGSQGEKASKTRSNSSTNSPSFRQ